MVFQILERSNKISDGKVNGKSEGLLFVCVKSRLLSRALPSLLTEEVDVKCFTLE